MSGEVSRMSPPPKTSVLALMSSVAHLVKAGPEPMTVGLELRSGRRVLLMSSPAVVCRSRIRHVLAALIACCLAALGAAAPASATVIGDTLVVDRLGCAQLDGEFRTIDGVEKCLAGLTSVDPIFNEQGKTIIVELDLVALNGIVNHGSIQVKDGVTLAARGTSWNDENGLINLGSTGRLVITDEPRTGVAGTLWNEGVIVGCEGGVEGDLQGGQVRKVCLPLLTPSVVGTAGQAGWYTSDVTVSWSTEGSNPAVTSPECPDTVIAADTAGQVVSCTASSSAGSTTGSVTIARDATAPVLTWASGTPADGSSFPAGTALGEPTCSATDDTSGVDDAGCVVTGFDNSAGTHTLTATVRDRAGNSAVEHRTYSIAGPWMITSFGSPVRASGVTTVRAGSTVPLKFEIFDGSKEITDPRLVSLLIEATACPGQTRATGPASAIPPVTYDPKKGAFAAKWRVPGVRGSCYTVTVSAGGADRPSSFVVK